MSDNRVTEADEIDKEPLSPSDPFEKGGEDIADLDQLTPDKAMEMLNSPKLKVIVYILINLIYNFNTCFVAAIPFLIDDPKFLCLKGSTYQSCDKKEACGPGAKY